jgi:HEAT repeat protein
MAHSLGTLLEAGGDSLDGLRAILSTEGVSADVRQTACWVLGRVGDRWRSIPLLVRALLHDMDPNVRGEAARSLSVVGSEATTRPLIMALSDPDPQVRVSAALALGSLTNELAFATLLARLGDVDEQPDVRGAAAEAVASYRDKRALAPLLAALRDPAAEVRFWAVFALGALGDASALPELERLEATDDAMVPGWWPVKQEAAEAIATIRTPVTACG